MDTRHLQIRKRTLLLSALLASACSDGFVPPADAVTPPRAALTDARGLRWELRRHEFAAEEPRAPENVEARADGLPWPQLSNDDAVSRLRPIALTPDNHEYTLSDRDALAFVQQLRELAPRLPRSAPMGVPDAAQVSERTGRVLSEDRFARKTFGEDDRANVNDEADQVPWRFIAAMANAGECTAFKLLNPQTALTAAHCVHDGVEWHRRKTLQFAAGASERRAELDADCYSIIVPAAWDGEDAEFDFAVLRLREEGLDGGASCERAAYDIGHFGYNLVDECVDGIALTLAGYPSRKDPDHPVPVGDWSYPSLFTDYRTDGWSACAGLYPSALFFYNDGSNGQSGSPVWSFYQDSGQNQVRGIHRGSMITVIGDSNRARRFDDSLMAWFTLNAGY
jgi:V8-like Glu-specific endopeptidase